MLPTHARESSPFPKGSLTETPAEQTPAASRISRQEASPCQLNSFKATAQTLQELLSCALLGTAPEGTEQPLPKVSGPDICSLSEVQQHKCVGPLRSSVALNSLHNYSPWPCPQSLKGGTRYLYITACLPILFLTKIPIKKMPRCVLLP